MTKRLATHAARLLGFKRLHGDERGAILLLSLAAVLILLLLAWVAFDAGPVARDKLELQGAADTAAYSQAAVRARTANYISYANVAKRSIVAITGLYPAMFFAYGSWIALQASNCGFTNPAACVRVAVNTPLYAWELANDGRNYSGLGNGSLWLATFGLLGSPGGNVTNYYREDLEALDNLQRYLFNLTGWWGWVEGVVRGMRNGATATSSFPKPRGNAPGGFPDIVTMINTALGSMSINSSNAAFPTTSYADTLPFEKRDWRGRHFRSVAAMAETTANALIHKDRSSLGANNSSVIAAGVALFYFGLPPLRPPGWKLVSDEYGNVDDPFLLQQYPPGPAGEAEWLTQTSTLTFAYLNRPERYGYERQKYGVPREDYAFRLGIADELTYRPSGVWSMARAEISFQGGDPNPFRAGWTARMRPVALPGEWADAGFTLNQAYHDVLPYIAFASLLGIGSFNYITASIWDFAAMERYTRAFGHTTIGGLVK